MSEADLRAVVEIEESLYEFPWTLGNFRDSLRAGYACFAYRDGRQLIGYAVLLLAAGEAHLLNLSVAAHAQRRGHGAACSSTWSESRESARLRSCSSKSGLRTRWDGASIPATASSRSAFGAATIRRIEAARTRWFWRSICDSIMNARSERYLEEMGLAPCGSCAAEAGTRPGFGIRKKIRGKPLARAGGFETAAAASSSANPSSRSGARGVCQARSRR